MKQHCCACHDADCEKEHINGAFKWCEMHLEGGRALGIVPKLRGPQPPVDVRTAQQIGPNPIMRPGMMVQMIQEGRLQQGPKDVKSAQEQQTFPYGLSFSAGSGWGNGQQSFKSAQRAWMGSCQNVGSGIMQTAVYVNTQAQDQARQFLEQRQAMRLQQQAMRDMEQKVDTYMDLAHIAQRFGK